MNNTSNNALKVVRKFLGAWKKLDHTTMWECVTPTWKLRNTEEQLAKSFHSALHGYKVGKCIKVTEVVFDVEVTLKGTDGESKQIVRTICEKGPFLPSAKGEMKLNPVSWRTIEDPKKDATLKKS